MARQRLGQHFLTGESWRRRIAASLPNHAGDTWIEIGAGHGEMTELLARPGRRLVAIETDARLVERLRERAREWPGVEVVAGDVLKTNLTQLVGDTRFRVFGNLPYYITSPILQRLFRVAEQIASIHVVVQFEVATRIAARPGRRAYGYLSALCQLYTHPAIVLRIPPGAFRPRPKVNSALLAMSLPGESAELGIEDDGQFLRFLQICFEHKRKTLRNNLRKISVAEVIEAALASSGISGDARAEQLTLRQFAGLFHALSR